jgi:hypothetical protein
MRTALSAYLFCYCALALGGEIDYPPRLSIQVHSKPTLDRPAVGGIQLGDLLVQLERTTLSEVMGKIGIGKIDYAGDAADSTTWLCYFDKGESSTQKVWLSSSELNGGTVIDSIDIVELDSGVQPSSECPLLTGQRAQVKFDNGLSIGASEGEVRRIIGKPSQRRGGWWSYSYSGKKQLMVDGRFVVYDVNSLFAIHMQLGKAVAVTASQSTTD